MRKTRTIPALLGALALSLASASPLAAAGPEMISARPFDVSVTNGVVNANFTLAMSLYNSYPVTITAISGAQEEVLYEGTLSEGSYRFSAPLQKISGHGELKVVLRTRITMRTEKGNETAAIYLTWQGSR